MHTVYLFVDHGQHAVLYIAMTHSVMQHVRVPGLRSMLELRFLATLAKCSDDVSVLQYFMGLHSTPWLTKQP